MTQSDQSKIYVASSWRNPIQPAIVQVLRAEGHDVYDFRHPRDGDNGFSWHLLDSSLPPGPADLVLPSAQIRDMLSHPIAEAGFEGDMTALRECDICVLVLPCGRSAHIEAGWAAGNGKRLIVLLDEGEPDLMWKMADELCITVEEMIAACARPALERAA